VVKVCFTIMTRAEIFKQAQDLNDEFKFLDYKDQAVVLSEIVVSPISAVFCPRAWWNWFNENYSE
jgi:hypothetical protein